MSIKQGAPGRSRRRHGEEFKARLVEECRKPGVSMASVAMANGVNANLLRNWVVRQAKAGSAPVAPVPAAKAEFIALPLAEPGGAVGDIRVEVRRGDATVTITWPASAASECAAWLRAWLR
jgi:transposase-like protein